MFSLYIKVRRLPKVQTKTSGVVFRCVCKTPPVAELCDAFGWITLNGITDESHLNLCYKMHYRKLSVLWPNLTWWRARGPDVPPGCCSLKPTVKLLHLCLLSPITRMQITWRMFYKTFAQYRFTRTNKSEHANAGNTYKDEDNPNTESWLVLGRWHLFRLNMSHKSLVLFCFKREKQLWEGGLKWNGNLMYINRSGRWRGRRQKGNRGGKHGTAQLDPTAVILRYKGRSQTNKTLPWVAQAFSRLSAPHVYINALLPGCKLKPRWQQDSVFNLSQWSIIMWLMIKGPLEPVRCG